MAKVPTMIVKLETKDLSELCEIIRIHHIVLEGLIKIVKDLESKSQNKFTPGSPHSKSFYETK